MEENLLNVEQIAELLDVPVSWVYQRTRKNDIPLYRLGKYVRFKASEVLAYYEEIGEPETEGEYGETSTHFLVPKTEEEMKNENMHPLRGDKVANVGETQTISVSPLRVNQE